MVCEVWGTSGTKLLGFVEAAPRHMEDFCDQCGDCLSCYSEDSCCGDEGREHRWVSYKGDAHPWLKAKEGGDGG